MNYVKGIHEFFSKWVTNGHSSFMHRQLYADSGYPIAVQDAFACITLHNAKTPSNEDIIDGIIYSKVSVLLESYSKNDSDVNLPTDLDIREHLSRTQALYVHLVLSLFSSSIGARANAEQHIQTLLSWTRQLWEAALRDPDICQSENGDGPAASTNAIVLDVMFDGDTTPRLWRSWVLSESIRRIWLMTTSTIGVYLTLRQKWAECHGGIYFTARKDIWNAKSASSWAAACRSGDPLFLCSLDCESLFLTAKAPEVDDLLINMFTIMWGAERVENWFARTAEPGQSVRVWRNSGPVDK
jgi:phenolic acid decarboxylase